MTKLTWHLNWFGWHWGQFNSSDPSAQSFWLSHRHAIGMQSFILPAIKLQVNLSLPQSGGIWHVRISSCKTLPLGHAQTCLSPLRMQKWEHCSWCVKLHLFFAGCLTDIRSRMWVAWMGRVDLDVPEISSSLWSWCNSLSIQYNQPEWTVSWIILDLLSSLTRTCLKNNTYIFNFILKFLKHVYLSKSTNQKYNNVTYHKYIT